MYDLNLNLNDIIAEKDEKNRRLLTVELRNLGGYETVEEFFKEIRKASEKNDPKALRLYRFAQWLSHESVFYGLMDLLDSLKTSVHMEYALKAITKIPENTEVLHKSVSTLLNSIQRFNDVGVLYQAVSLLHRMEEVDKSLRDCLKSHEKIIMDESVLIEAGNRIENLAKYESDFHKNSDVRAEFTSKDEFIEFVNLFTKFKNTV